MLLVVTNVPMYDGWQWVTLAAASNYYSVLVGFVCVPTSTPTIVAIQVTSMTNLVKL